MELRPQPQAVVVYWWSVCACAGHALLASILYSTHGHALCFLPFIFCHSISFIPLSSGSLSPSLSFCLSLSLSHSVYVCVPPRSFAILSPAARPERSVTLRVHIHRM